MLNDTELPHELILSIHRILDLQQATKDDPLDVVSNDFSCVEILNELFPDEASLAQISAVQARLADNEKKVKEEITFLQEELKRDQDPSRMLKIQEMISDLLGQMSRIREKATESEAVVRNITKDIQVLDRAKKNLINSMTTLKRLQMLVNALTQLDDFVKERRYPDIAQSLAAVKQLSASFKQHMSVPRIMHVFKRVQELQGEIRTQLDKDFDTFYMQDPSKPIKPSVIADACHVVDVLGPDVRSYVIDKYVALELKEYRRIFRLTDEAGQLDNISRRFAWFRRLLQTHETEQGKVFPEEWKVGWFLLGKFNEITRDDLSNLLSKARPTLTVKSLLDDLQLTADFELSMAKKWSTLYHDMINEVSTTKGQSQRTMSSSFEPHLSIFVDAQDKAIAGTLAPHRKSKQQPIPRHSLDAPAQNTGDDSGGETSAAGVLPSSTELFYFYGQSLEQCAKLSIGQALFDLCAVYKKWLHIYAEDVLIASMKRAPVVSRRSMDSRFDANELKQACLVINTADYCQTTALELEEKIKSKISPSFKEKVSLQEERDVFVSVISSAILAQLRELDTVCDGPLSTMGRTQWSGLPQVSGPSPWSDELVKAAEQVIEVIKPLVEQKRYLKNIFDKAVSLILAKFTNSLVKSRPLKEIGAEQLLIDLQVIKAYLHKLPGEALITPGYTRALTKGTTRLETLLKVIVTPVDPPEGFILNYTLLIGDASFTNFQKILDLKGTPKADQNALLDSFLTLTSTKDDLESTSFLSSLDMEPSAAGLGTSLMSPSASRVNLAEGVFAGLTSPPASRPITGSNDIDSSASARGSEQKAPQVFSDFRRFVSFGLRRDTQGPA